MPPARQVRAVFDDRTVTVYQAYGAHIAEPAVRAGTFVPPFNVTGRPGSSRPFCGWCTAGWATKPGQERVLAVRITRDGFEQALGMAALSRFDRAVQRGRAAWSAAMAASPVRVQWDPERGPELNPLPWRAIQIGLCGGLCGPAVRAYVTDWIVDITDVTGWVRTLRSSTDARAALPAERGYPLPGAIAANIGATADPIES